MFRNRGVGRRSKVAVARAGVIRYLAAAIPESEPIKRS
jgi:hypothetical protein